MSVDLSHNSRVIRFCRRSRTLFPPPSLFRGIDKLKPSQNGAHSVTATTDGRLDETTLRGRPSRRALLVALWPKQPCWKINVMNSEAPIALGGQPRINNLRQGPILVRDLELHVACLIQKYRNVESRNERHAPLIRYKASTELYPVFEWNRD